MHPISAGTAFKRPSFEALQREAARLGAQIKLVRGFRFVDPWEYTCAEKSGGGVAQIAIALDLPTWVVQAWAKKVARDRAFAPCA